MLNLTTEENYADWSLYSSEDYGILHYFPDENAAMSSKNESLSSEELVDSVSIWFKAVFIFLQPKCFGARKAERRKMLCSSAFCNVNAFKAIVAFLPILKMALSAML